MVKERIARLGLFIVLLGMVFYCYEYFLRVAPSFMQSNFMEAFSINATLFGTLSGFYYYAYTPMQLVVGIAVDRYSVRYVLTVAILACAVGSYLFAATHVYSIAAVGRFLQGFGSAFAFVSALKLISRYLPATYFASFSGLCTSIGFLGGASSDIILTHLVQSLGWRYLMSGFVIMGLVLALVFWLVSGKRAHAYHEDHPKQNVSLAVAIKQLGHIIKMPYIWVAGIIAALLYLPTSVFADLWGIPYMEKVHGYSLSQAGIAISMIYFGWIIAGPFWGLVSNYWQRRLRIIALGSLFAAVSAIVLLYDSHLPFVLLCFLFVLFGMASSIEILAFAMAHDVSTEATAGMAIAFTNFICMMSGLIFQREIGKILDHLWSGQMANGIPVYSSANYQHAMMVIPISLLLSFIIAMICRDKPLKQG